MQQISAYQLPLDYPGAIFPSRLEWLCQPEQIEYTLRRLAALCIAPVDLLPIRDNRLYFLDGYETWGDRDISDQRKLDPEGYSEIALRYSSPDTEFIFHLLLRWAETLVPVELGKTGMLGREVFAPQHARFCCWWASQNSSFLPAHQIELEKKYVVCPATIRAFIR